MAAEVYANGKATIRRSLLLANPVEPNVEGITQLRRAITDYSSGWSDPPAARRQPVDLHHPSITMESRRDNVQF